MAMVARTVTGTVGAATVPGTITLTGVISMVMDTGKIMVMDTATLADPEFPSCNGGCHELAIIMAPSTESWDHKRGEQSGPTSKTTIAQVNPTESCQAGSKAIIIFRLIGRRSRRERGERAAGHPFLHRAWGQFRPIVSWDVATGFVCHCFSAARFRSV